MSDQETNPIDPSTSETFSAPQNPPPIISHTMPSMEPNPYGGTAVANLDAGDSRLESLTPESKPRIWPIPITLLLTMFASITLSVVVIAAVVTTYMNANPGTTLNKAIEVTTGTWWGVMLLLIPAQGAILAGAVLPAVLSPVPFKDRLGLHRGTWPIWGWLAACIAGPFLATLWTLLMSQFISESESLKMLSKMFRETAAAGYLIPLVLMIAGMPSIAEEWLFRGYVQTRLLQRISPFWAVGISSILFAVWHLDPVHILGVLPLGFWLGWVCWRAGSILPAMCIHFVNNSISVIETANGTEVLDFSLSWLMLSVLILGLPCLLACLWLAWKIPVAPKNFPTAANEH